MEFKAKDIAALLKGVVEGSKRKQLVKTERTIVRKDIKEIKDVVKFWTGKTDKVNNQ